MGRGGWVGAVCTFWYECPLVVLACKSLHVCTVCIWRCEHARFCVEVFHALYINFHSFIHSRITARRLLCWVFLAAVRGVSLRLLYWTSAQPSAGRAQELCESRGDRPGLPVPNTPDGFCGCKATLKRMKCLHDHTILLEKIKMTFGVRGVALE